MRLKKKGLIRFFVSCVVCFLILFGVGITTFASEVDYKIEKGQSVILFDRYGVFANDERLKQVQDNFNLAKYGEIAYIMPENSVDVSKEEYVEQMCSEVEKLQKEVYEKITIVTDNYYWGEIIASDYFDSEDVEIYTISLKTEVVEDNAFNETAGIVTIMLGALSVVLYTILLMIFLLEND